MKISKKLFSCFATIVLIISFSENLNANKELLEAARKNNIEMVAQILREGTFDIDFQATDETTPLWWAARHGEEASDIAILLLEKGANVNIQAKNGTTPLGWFVFSKNIIVLNNLSITQLSSDSLAVEKVQKHIEEEGERERERKKERERTYDDYGYPFTSEEWSNFSGYCFANASRREIEIERERERERKQAQEMFNFTLYTDSYYLTNKEEEEYYKLLSQRLIQQPKIDDEEDISEAMQNLFIEED